jgi:hypothetical protein
MQWNLLKIPLPGKGKGPGLPLPSWFRTKLSTGFSPAMWAEMHSMHFERPGLSCLSARLLGTLSRRLWPNSSKKTMANSQSQQQPFPVAQAGDKVSGGAEAWAEAEDDVDSFF